MLISWINITHAIYDRAGQQSIKRDICTSIDRNTCSLDTGIVV